MTTFSLQDQDLFRRQAYIGGRWCDSDTGATLEVNNPATGEILGTVPLMGANETRRAIEAAKNAFVDWGRKPAKERSALLRRWHDLIMANWRLWLLDRARIIAPARMALANTNAACQC
jgi:succinate-semialdehyde dehydrogenase / glutarate-semialdehyde dehydrogenase